MNSLSGMAVQAVHGGRVSPSHLENTVKNTLAVALARASQEQALTALALVDPVAVVDHLLQAQPTAAASEQDQLLGRVVPVLLQGGRRAELRRLLPVVLGAKVGGSVAAAVAEAHVGNEAAGSHQEFEELLNLAPAEPAVLRLVASVRERAGDHAGAHALLTRLAFADPSLRNVRQVHRCRSRLAAPAAPAVRVALLGSHSLDVLALYIDAECHGLGLAPTTYTAPFNSWERESLDPGAGLRSFDADVAILAVALDDLVPGLAGGTADEVNEAAGQEAVDRIAAAAERISSWSRGSLIVHGLYSAYGDPLGIAEGAARSLWIAELNQRLSQRLKQVPRTHFVDVADVLLRRAAGPLDNPKLRHFATLRLSPEAAARLAHAHAGHIAAVKGLTRKCVVVDLDNTLWGGVLGEDGPDGIRLGPTAPGVEHLDLQRCLHSLASRGVLLAVASKNNESEALSAMAQHPFMLLRPDSFAAVQIHWEPKPDSLRRIAQELNIGLDSLVFVDDSPHERALMRQTLPEVLTPELPADPALYRQVIESLPQLQTLSVSEEDRLRVGMYRARRQREQVRAEATSLDGYLASLGVEVTVLLDDPRSTDRIHQLLQRTNQFNLTTRRHDASAIAEWITQDNWSVYGASARDRYGVHGLSAAAIVRADREAWIIDSFVMSCRVISYGIESALLAAIADDAAEQAVPRLVGEFVPTAKNAPANDFYPRHDFVAGEEVDGARRFVLELSGSRPRSPSWIRVERR